MAEVRLTPGGTPQIILPDPPVQVVNDLAGAGRDRRQLVKVAAAYPELPQVWAALGAACEPKREDLGGQVEAYAYYRIGYHRGLDALRQNGWRGSGYVRWSHPSNRGFLASLDGLRRMAESIGETAEAQRCADFLGMLDPSYTPRPGP